MSLKELFKDSDLTQPPLRLDDNLLRWVREAEDVLDFVLIDEVPLSSADLERLRKDGRFIPEELAWYYQHVTPWVRMGNGCDVWFEHMDIAHERLREASRRRESCNATELEKHITGDPMLFPVNLSHKATAIAFQDSQQRLVVFEGNIGPNLGRPMAIGLRNYLVQQVVVEIVWCDEDYKTYAETLDDPLVREAGGWPKENCPTHIFIETYQDGYWKPNKKKPN